MKGLLEKDDSDDGRGIFGGFLQDLEKWDLQSPDPSLDRKNGGDRFQGANNGGIVDQSGGRNGPLRVVLDNDNGGTFNSFGRYPFDEPRLQEPDVDGGYEECYGCDFLLADDYDDFAREEIQTDTIIIDSPVNAGGEQDVQSSFDQPSFDQPSFDQPSFDQPSFNQLSFDQPSFDPPSFNQPSFNRPPFTQSGNDDNAGRNWEGPVISPTNENDSRRNDDQPSTAGWLASAQAVVSGARMGHKMFQMFDEPAPLQYNGVDSPDNQDLNTVADFTFEDSVQVAQSQPSLHHIQDDPGYPGLQDAGNNFNFPFQEDSAQVAPNQQSFYPAQDDTGYTGLQDVRNKLWDLGSQQNGFPGSQDQQQNNDGDSSELLSSAKTAFSVLRKIGQVSSVSCQNVCQTRELTTISLIENPEIVSCFAAPQGW
jgi:hypothetical protein